jgi:hypothetical protein|tara:strand:+ start:168 stop:422 length:255 start_codon:yes stop_codon:yes gene_type:complete
MISNYFNKQNNNTLVSTSRGDVYYSYQTQVAFRTPQTGLVVRENEWGPTTGKHLNSIDGGSKIAKHHRINGDTFMDQLQQSGLN